MKQIKHHLNDALLMGYAAGTLPEAFNLVVATHVSICDDCRARMHSFDAIGGEIVESVDAVPVNDACLAATLALLAVQWKRVGGGVSQAVLKTRDAATVRLLRIPGGVAVPDHGHGGMELTLVLQGAFSDATDRFGAGDVEIADEAMVHKPVAEAGVDCICLAATDAPLRFSGILPRMVQSIFRM
jgi:putative transcriptional regulator